MCGPIHSLKSTYAGSVIFALHREFLFFDFAARKINIFSRPDVKSNEKDSSGLTMQCYGQCKSIIDLMHNDVTRLDAREECWS